jgi:uncharacterized protein (UPF0335 family)
MLKQMKMDNPHLADYIDEAAASLTGEGHNSGGITGAHLRQYVERIERLEDDKKAIAEDMKEVFCEAKSNGFDVKIMRKVIAMRKKPKNELDEELALIDLYCHALGMTPLEEAINKTI